MGLPMNCYLWLHCLACGSGAVSFITKPAPILHSVILLLDLFPFRMEERLKLYKQNKTRQYSRELQEPNNQSFILLTSSIGTVVTLSFVQRRRVIFM